MKTKKGIATLFVAGLIGIIGLSSISFFGVQTANEFETDKCIVKLIDKDLTISMKNQNQNEGIFIIPQKIKENFSLVAIEKDEIANTYIYKFKKN